MFGGNTSQNTGGFSFGGSNTGTSNTGSNLFGGSKPASGGAGLFGNRQQQQQPAAGSSLFGSNPQQQTSGGLFGSNSGAQQSNSNSTGGLFGGNSNQQPSSTGGLFGANSSQQSTATGGLFGNNSNQQSSSTGGLFGNNSNQQQPSTGGLFGSNQQKPTTGGLFGNNTSQQAQPQQQQNAGGLFGGSQNTSSGGLFGAKPATGGLFGNNAPAQQQAGGLFNNSNNSTQQPLMVTSSQPSFAWSQAAQQQGTQPQIQPLSLQTQPDQFQQQQQQQQNNSNSTNYTPTINDQLLKIKNSWDPNSQSCILKTYFYNKTEDLSVLSRPADELPEEWEKAMNNRPKNYNTVPVKARGFDDLLRRTQIQIDHIKQSRIILNNINETLINLNNLQVLQIQQKLTSCKLNAKKLSKKLLKIAIVIMILKNYKLQLSNFEENLIQKFDKLNEDLKNPTDLGKLNELWSRLSNLKERGRNLTLQLENMNNNLLEFADASGASNDAPNAVASSSATRFVSSGGGSSNSVSKSAVTNKTTASTKDENNDKEILNRLTKALAKQQAGIQYLYDILEKDKEVIENIAA